MKCNLNSLQGVIQGNYIGTTIDYRVVKEETGD